MKINKGIFKKDFIDLCKNIETLYTLVGVPVAILILFFFFSKQETGIFLTFNRHIAPLFLEKILDGLNLNIYPASRALFLLQWNTVYFYIIGLLIFALPIVISSTAFTSEKEQGTIEILFHAPISDSDLLFTKMFVSTIPSILLGALCYLFMLISSYSHSGYQTFLYMLQLKWLLLHFIIIPLYAILSAGIGLCISMIKKNSRAALLLSMLAILPLLLAIVPLIYGNVLFTLKVAIICILIVLFLLFIVALVALKLFNREKILLSYY